MAKFVALYTKPEDVEGFEAHYRDVHLPLVATWPGVESFSTTRLTGTPRGGEPDYHLAFEATFASDEAMRESMASDGAREVGRDAVGMVKRFGNSVTMALGEDF